MTQKVEFISQQPINKPIHSIALFDNAFNPIASKRLSELTAMQVINEVAPADGLRLIRRKETVEYFVPAELRNAPFVGNTAKRFPGQSGYQRSTTHVVSSSFFAFDLDGLSGKAWMGIQKTLVALDLLFCAYSSWSYGLKPGIRVRVVIFMDRAVKPQEWKAIWKELNERLFFGLVDKQTGHLAQQAGVWATHPDRAEQAFREVAGSKLLSADNLLESIPKEEKKRHYSRPARCDEWSSGRSHQRMEDALHWIDPNQYHAWINTCIGLKAGVRLGDLSAEEGYSLWRAFSERASESKKANNDDPRYDPDALWEQMESTAAPPEALYARLFAEARDQAMQQVRASLVSDQVTSRSEQAAVYLGRFHPATFDRVVEMEVGHG